MVILFVPTMSAQASAQPAAAKVEVVSGNGQMICRGCGQKIAYFHPMVVKVTDASGNPIAGKTVNWQLVSSTPGGPPDFDSTTSTNSDGLSVSRLFAAPVTAPGSSFTPYLQGVISATVDGAHATFTETLALATSPPFTIQIIFPQLVTDFGTVLTGAAGSTSTTAIQVHIDGAPVPNVSVRILSPEVTTDSGQVIIDPTLPSASCVTGAGADPGSVLTDANGNASCIPVFGPTAGNGPVSVLVGGLDPVEFDQTITDQPLTSAVSYQEFHNAIRLVVAPVSPGHIDVFTGNNQSVDPGRPSAPLVVRVTDLSGTVTIANTKVAWAVFPPAAATLSEAVSATNALGQAQNVVTFVPGASGQITVKASLTGIYSGLTPATFTLSTNVQIANLIISGDSQTTQAGQKFGQPLIVTVIGTNGQPLSNQPVSFVISGNVILSSNFVLTGLDGSSEPVTVTAGSTPGPVSIKAFVGNFSKTFTLTIIPPGPVLSPGSFQNAGGGSRLSALSPCSLVTVVNSGLAPNVLGQVFNANSFGPWGTTLASDTVTVNNVAAPVFSVGNINGVEQLTFQVPCETAPGGSVPVTINVGGGVATINLPVQAATPGIFETVMSDGVRRAVVIRPDGTFVSLQNPARRSETLRVYVTGLGPTAPVLATGAFPVPGIDSLLLGQLIVGVNGSGAGPYTARVSPNLIGVYEVTFQVPSDAITGNDVVLSVGVIAPGDVMASYSNGSKLPIQ